MISLFLTKNSSRDPYILHMVCNFRLSQLGVSFSHQTHSLSSVYTDFRMNSFIYEVSILIFYTVEIEYWLRKYSKKNEFICEVSIHWRQCHWFYATFLLFQLNSLTLMELNTIRPFLTKALDQIQVLRANTSQGAVYGQSQD